MFTSNSKYISLVVFITLLFTIGNLFLLYKNVQTIRANAASVNHTHTVKQELAGILQALTDAETGQRGYLITNDERYLKPYIDAKPTMFRYLNDVENLTHDNPIQQANVDELRALVQQRMNWLEEGVKMRTEQNYESAQTFITTGVGITTMIEVREKVSAMLIEEDRLLKVRENQTNSSFRTLNITSGIGGLFNIGLILLSFYLIKEELQRRNQLEKNKDDFISMASHELKTPITSLNIYTQIAVKNLERKKYTETKKLLEKITNQTARLSSLVTDLLDISRVQTGKLKIEHSPFDIDALIHETVESIQQTTAKHKITVKSTIKRQVNGDRYRIYQVLTNLLTNAVKYSPKGKKITVHAKSTRKEVVIAIKDQGIGIEKKHQKKIFQKLYQVTDSHGNTYPGFGIGLYISSQIIRQHRGKIWVESKKEKGSTFSFSIPFNDNA